MKDYTALLGSYNKELVSFLSGHEFAGVALSAKVKNGRANGSPTVASNCYRLILIQLPDGGCYLLRHLLNRYFKNITHCN